MHVILAADTDGVLNALKGAPYYMQLGAAAVLGAGAYLLKELRERRGIDSFFLELVEWGLAIAGFLLAYQGIFGSK